MGKDIPRNSGQQPKCYEGVLCSMQYAFWYREDNQLSGRHDVKRHIERAASTGVDRWGTGGGTRPPPLFSLVGTT